MYKVSYTVWPSAEVICAFVYSTNLSYVVDFLGLHMAILVPTDSCSPLPSNCIHLCVCVSSAAFVDNGYVSTFPVKLHALCRLQRLRGSLTNHLMYCRVEEQRMALS